MTLLLLFLLLIVSWRLTWHLENRRRIRNEEQQQRKREVFHQLLDVLQKEHKTRD